MADANIRAVITAKDEASKVLSGFGNSVERAGKASAVVLAAAGAAAVGFGVLAVKAFSESENAIAQTNAVLKSTGGVAGVTADEVTRLATSLQKVTKYSDEDVRSVENLLLTFTSIGKDIFPQATKTVLDMATALGEDTKSASIQLGKALQDPVLGITALRRVGVNFSDKQKDVIQSLVDTGRSAEAQKLILAELTREFGGSAEAAGKTFAGQLTILKNQLDDLMEIVGGVIVTAIQPLVQGLLNWVESAGGVEGVMNKINQTLEKLRPWLPEIAGALIGLVVPAFYAMATSILANVAALAPFIAAGALLALAYDKAPALFYAIVGALAALATTILVAEIPAIYASIVALGQMTIALITATGGIAAVGAAMGVMAYLVITHSNEIKTAIADLRNWFNSLPGAIRTAVTVGASVLQALIPPINFLISSFQSVLAIVNKVRDAFSSLSIGNVKEKLHSLHIPGFASGVTNFSGGLAVVGEQGAELVNLPKGSDVIPNHKIGAVAGGGAPINITLQAGFFNGSDVEARKYAMTIVEHLKDIASSRGTTVAQMIG